MNETAKQNAQPKESNYFKGAIDVANTMKFMQDSNVEGGKKLAKVISTIMSWGGEAGEDSVTGGE